ncbi:hypothetical protein M0R72_20550 [Candidatus Pacearchaeota archaeon]|jgi:transaldolase|nr:hypothetical protein [Candidatus Pacearchaeota archaeon]
MADSYFLKLKAETPTRLWVNNPTVPETEAALANGAVSCTTNPTYCANMLKRDYDYASRVIGACIKEGGSVEAIANRAQQTMAARIMRYFRPVYDRSKGADGFVSIQDNPRADESAQHIIEESRSYKKLGPNFIVKIPATKAGLAAIETLLAEGIPVIATEVFGIAQMTAACEVYKKATVKLKTKPAYFVTHITGIFDEYLKETTEKQGINIAPAVLAQAGAAVCRKQYRIMIEQGYPGIMLGGGARNTGHFTDFVGGAVHITINWSTAEEILAQNMKVEERMSVRTHPAAIDELREKLPDFRKAWDENGLAVDDFAGYGPVQRFRNQFIRGWDALIGEIEKRKQGKV